ncbi:hypothetical protein FI667_g4165, partial [Globisporangium splendens]
MPTSPDRRTIQSRVTKKLSAAPGSTLSKSASESSLNKKKQGSLLEQELLPLERDEGKRHARELSACLLEYAKKIDDLHSTLIERIREMENDIDRRIVKMNERLNINRKLRETIDVHRAERARMDTIYTKISSETLSKRHKIARASNETEKLRQEVGDIEQQIEDIRQEGEEWEMKCDQKAALLLQELKEIALHQKDEEEMVDVDKHKYLGGERYHAQY